MRPGISTPIRDLLHATVGAAASLALPPVKSFVVLSSGRSGSNLLSSLMKSHPKITQHGEIFGEYQLESRVVRRRIKQVGACAYLDRRLSRMTTERAAGVKILYNNLEARYGEVRGAPGTEKLLDHIAARRDLRVIHLVREDKAALLISNRLANELQRWTGGGYGDQTITIPVDWAREQIAYLESWNARITAAIPPDRLLAMTYEALAADPPTEMSSVFSFIGVEAAPVSTAMSKQNRRSKFEVVENIDELREAFGGTAHERYFAAD